MSNKSKILPVLALAAVLSPFAAAARSNPAPVAQQQYLAGDFGDQHVASNVQGRAAQDHPSGGLFVLSSVQYAAVRTVSDEN
jgi:hypothetical protein